MKLKIAISIVTLIFGTVSFPSFATGEMRNRDYQISHINGELSLSDSEGSESNKHLDNGMFDGRPRQIEFKDGSLRRVSLIHGDQNDDQILGVVQDSNGTQLLLENFDKKSEVMVDGQILNSLRVEGRSQPLSITPFAAHVVTVKETRKVSENERQRAIQKGIDPMGLVGLSITSLNIQPLALAVTPTYTRFRYQTFIPTRTAAPTIKLTCPTLYNQPYQQGYFLGENRSWNPDSIYNKTLLDFKINWSTLTLTNITKYVATTQVIYVSAQGVETYGPSANAGTSGMDVVVSSRSATQVQVHMTHDIANPLCAGAEGIYYDIYATAFISGSYTMAGSLVRVPNHEFYVRDSTSTAWTTIHRLTMTSFDDLIPPRITSNVSKSGVIN